MQINIKKKFKCAAAYVLFVCLIGAFAQAGILDEINSSKEITVVIGEAKPLRVQNPRQVKIGNPKVLDVVGAGRGELLLSGLSAGETMLTVADDFGQHIYTVKIFQHDLEQVKERVDMLLEVSGFNQITTQIGDQEQKVFLLGQLSQSKKEAFESKIESVKDKIINLVDYYDNTPSVEIDVEVLEIRKDDLDKLGFVWNQSIAFSEPIGNVPSNFPVDNLLNPKHALQILKDWRTTQLVATLNVLKQNNKARTLSRPKLVCLSGKEANLLVGGETPIITGSSTSSQGGSFSYSENVEYKEYGITLDIKPVVNADDTIQVSLNVEISDVDTATQRTLSSGVTTPGFIERSAQTELMIPNGKTVFLAGMIKSYDKNNRAEVPFLGKIPFLGALFRNKDLELDETEIVISLTPTIIRHGPEENTAASAVDKTKTQKLGSQAANINMAVKRLSQKDDPVVKYSALIQNIINSNIKYPQDLKEEKVEGSVKLSLHLLASGALSGVVIMRSSGHTILDEAAEYSVRRLSPFPAFPLEIKLKELWIDIPIVYKE